MKILLIALAILPLSSFASIGTRGGGNARVCFTNAKAAEAARLNPLDRDIYWSSIDSIEVLDLFEAKLPRGDLGMSPSIMEAVPGETARAFAERVAKRFDNHMQLVAETIRKGKEAFSQNQIIWSKEPFGKTDDIDPALHYENKFCSILGLAFQKEVNGQEKLFIDQELFTHPKHSLLSRNITFLHEYIYRYARNLGHKTSSPTREAVGLAISVLPKGVDRDEADSWGLSVGKISAAFFNSDLFSISRLYSSSDVASSDLSSDFSGAEDFNKFQVLLATTPEGQAFRQKISEILSRRKPSDDGVRAEHFFNELGTCSVVDNPYLILKSCLVVAENFNTEFTNDPILKKELEDVYVQLKRFLFDEGPTLASERILPLIFKDVETRLTNIKMDKKHIRSFQTLLGQKLIETMNKSYFNGQVYVFQNIADFEQGSELLQLIEEVKKGTLNAPELK